MSTSPGNTPEARKPLRIVTRPDFDGIICAVLLRRAEQISSEISWIEPNDIQSGTADIRKGDVLANLPYAEGCTLWFDHHVSNQPDGPFNGAFEIAPSAARVVYDYYLKKRMLDHRYDTLVEHTDIIDAALLDQDQVRFPEKYPYIILSMTIKNKGASEIAYWNRLVDLFSEGEIETVMQEKTVKERCARAIEENQAFKSHLRAHTRVQNNISITDFRELDPVPDGNRFLTYCLFPESIASVKIRYKSPEREKILLSIGQSIFNKKCNVNIGQLLAQFGGGGHKGAGGCTLDAEGADRAIEQILDVMFQNKPLR